MSTAIAASQIAIISFSPLLIRAIRAALKIVASVLRKPLKPGRRRMGAGDQSVPSESLPPARLLPTPRVRMDRNDEGCFACERSMIGYRGAMA
jgi:hypothetical protein